MAGDCFFSDLLEEGDSVSCGGDSGVWESVGYSAGFITHHQEEWGVVSGIMFPMIMDEFSHGEVLRPFRRGCAAVDSKVGF